jgi:hypothetical protein
MDIANTLAYCDTANITAVKSFIVQAQSLVTKEKVNIICPEGLCYKSFYNHGLQPRHHDTQHNDIQHNGAQHNNETSLGSV